MELFAADRPSAPRIYPPRIAGGLEVTVIAGAPSEPMINGRVHRYTASDVSVVYPGDTWRSRSSRAYRSFAIEAALWAELGGGDLGFVGHALRGPEVRTRTLRAFDGLVAARSPDERLEVVRGWLGEVLARSPRRPQPAPTERFLRVRQYAALMEREPARRWSHDDLLAALPGWSRHQLARAFRQELGCSVREHLHAVRVRRARQRMASGHPVHDLVADLGFYDRSHFRRVFRSIYGVSPERLRPGAALELPPGRALGFLTP